MYGSYVEFHGITIFRENYLCIKSIHGSVRIYGIATFDKNYAAINAYDSFVDLSGHAIFSNHDKGVLLVSTGRMNCTGEIYFNNNTAVTRSGVMYADRARVHF